MNLRNRLQLLRSKVAERDHHLDASLLEEIIALHHNINRDYLSKESFLHSRFFQLCSSSNPIEYCRVVDQLGNAAAIDADPADSIPGWFTITAGSLQVAFWLAHLLGLRHQSVHVFLDPPLPETTLVQFRSFKIMGSPGLFDAPAAGHVSGDDDPMTAAKRELREELNIRPSDLCDELSPLGSYTYQETRDNELVSDIEFRTVYYGCLSSDGLLSVKLQPDEVAAISIFSLPELKHLISAHPNLIASALRVSAPYYFRMKSSQ